MLLSKLAAVSRNQYDTVFENVHDVAFKNVRSIILPGAFLLVLSLLTLCCLQGYRGYYQYVIRYDTSLHDQIDRLSDNLYRGDQLAEWHELVRHFDLFATHPAISKIVLYNASGKPVVSKNGRLVSLQSHTGVFKAHYSRFEKSLKRSGEYHGRLEVFVDTGVATRPFFREKMPGILAGVLKMFLMILLCVFAVLGVFRKVGRPQGKL